METEFIIILITFGLLSIFYSLKRHYHFIYLKETDLRLKGIQKIDELTMTHKRDLESHISSQLAQEVMWTTILPTFKSDLGRETEKAKQVSRRIKIIMSFLYVTGILLIAEVMKFSGII